LEKHRNRENTKIGYECICKIDGRKTKEIFYSIKYISSNPFACRATKQVRDAATSHELMSIEPGGHTTWLDEEQLASCNSDTQAFH
jgi:hypothetical protein